MAGQMIRDDMSSKLVHLTRGEPDQVAANAFLSIVSQRKVLGGTTFIKGGYFCVCFSEAPLSKLAQILANTDGTGMRYKPFGVMVDKAWLFGRGGRPVIYQPDSEFQLLPESHRYRHVRYEPAVVDYTWEREWRVQTQELEFTHAEATLVVPNRAWEQWALREYTGVLARRALLTGFTGPALPAWHFIVLEDLGVEFPAAIAPPT